MRAKCARLQHFTISSSLCSSIGEEANGSLHSFIHSFIHSSAPELATVHSFSTLFFSLVKLVASLLLSVSAFPGPSFSQTIPPLLGSDWTISFSHFLILFSQLLFTPPLFLPFVSSV